MRAALYARVSTSEEADLQNPETQLMRLRQFASARGYTIINTYVDHASGADPNREALGQMMEAARRREFDAIIIVRLDRIMRSLVNLLAVLEDLETWHVRLICVDQPIETGTASGKLTLQILGALAEWEREIIRDRAKDGIARWQRENPDKTWGRQVRDDIDLHLALALINDYGHSLRRAAARLDVSPSTLSDHLKRAGYVRDPTTGAYGLPTPENHDAAYILPAEGEPSDAEV